MVYNIMVVVLSIIILFLLFWKLKQDNKIENLIAGRKFDKDLLKNLNDRLNEKDLEVKSIQSNIIRCKETITTLNAKVKILNSKAFNEKQGSNRAKRLPQSPVQNGGNIKG